MRRAQVISTVALVRSPLTSQLVRITNRDKAKGFLLADHSDELISLPEILRFDPSQADGIILRSFL